MKDPRPDRVRAAEDTILDLHAELERLRAVNADMLAALQACIDEWGYENPAHDFDAITQARAAKAKATLEPNVNE